MIIDLRSAGYYQMRTWADLIDIIVEECGHPWGSTGFAEFVRVRWGMVFHYNNPKSLSQATSIEIDESALLMLELKYYGRVEF